ncbi:hypothetical protein HAHE_13120 [Haloferula helveola]|uniref:Uncharacterized protein n=1 Tax=Haloferula helveola TaxID=490095 RepID=A0ABN6H1E2_9BACT|nr:hypothetical protein HAHE_13120 [Haloferula helveola]
MFRLPIVLPVLAASTAAAFPPAPYDTIYGVVRDQVGKTIVAEGAELVLLKGADEVERVPIMADAWVDRNYELKIKIDANRPQTRIYNLAALPAQGLFSLAVDMNGSRFYPIETSAGLFSTGQGGEQRRLDLNLGLDSDGDGIPDVWEQWQLYQAGYSPGENGWDLSLIDRDGDFDSDGSSNWTEYVAGTFAGDATERFDMEVREKADSFVRFEFFAITGKTYTIERSQDGQVWTEVPFGLSPSADRFLAHQADGVAVLSAYCAPSGDPNELFRLNVR